MAWRSNVIWGLIVALVLAAIGFVRHLLRPSSRAPWRLLSPISHPPGADRDSSGGRDTVRRNGRRIRPSLLMMAPWWSAWRRAVYSAKSWSRAASQMATTAGCVTFRSSVMA